MGIRNFSTKIARIDNYLHILQDCMQTEGVASQILLRHTAASDVRETVLALRERFDGNIHLADLIAAAIAFALPFVESHAQSNASAADLRTSWRVQRLAMVGAFRFIGLISIGRYGKCSPCGHEKQCRSHSLSLTAGDCCLLRARDLANFLASPAGRKALEERIDLACRHRKQFVEMLSGRRIAYRARTIKASRRTE